MNKQAATLISAVLLMTAAASAQAAPSTQQITRLPTVVVTGKAIKQLPTVVVTGYTIEGQLRRQMLAQAAAAKPARRG